MTLYDIIFDWFASSIFPNSVYDLDNISFAITEDYSLSMADWLCHTSTIIVLVALVICCALFVRWIFKVVSGAILLK